jgi:hypothetical protein
MLEEKEGGTGRAERVYAHKRREPVVERSRFDPYLFGIFEPTRKARA